MFYVLESVNISAVCSLVYSNDNGFGTSFFSGIKIDEQEVLQSIYVEFENNAIDLPEYFEVAGVPVVSKKFIDILEALKINTFQVFPVEIKFKKTTKSGYFVLNIIGKIKCFDHDHTSCSRFGPRIARVFSLKLQQENILHVDVFRSEEYSEIIFISEQLKAHLLAANISGCEIRNADGWSDAHRF